MTNITPEDALRALAAIQRHLYQGAGGKWSFDKEWTPDTLDAIAAEMAKVHPRGKKIVVGPATKLLPGEILFKKRQKAADAFFASAELGYRVESVSGWEWGGNEARRTVYVADEDPRKPTLAKTLVVRFADGKGRIEFAMFDGHVMKPPGAGGRRWA
jgi:hypothetical protein